MNQEEKARIYDECLRESDMLQRANSKLKSEHVNNITPAVQQIIDRNNQRISELVTKLESLFL